VRDEKSRRWNLKEEWFFNEPKSRVCIQRRRGEKKIFGVFKGEIEEEIERGGGVQFKQVVK